MIIAAHRAGWRVAAHAIGDRAIDLALDAFDAAASQYPRRDPRHRIEHFAAARPDQVARAAALGVIPVGQGRFATELGDGMLAAVGPDRQLLALPAAVRSSTPAWCCPAAPTGRS